MNNKIITNIMACILIVLVPFILKFFQRKKDERELSAFLNVLKVTTFITTFVFIFIGYVYTDFDILSIPTIFVFGLMIFMFISTYILYKINISEKDVSIQLSKNQKRKLSIFFRIILLLLLILSLSFGNLLNKFLPFNKIDVTVECALIFLLIITNFLYPLKNIYKDRIR